MKRPAVIEADKPRPMAIVIVEPKIEGKCQMDLVHRQVKSLSNVVEVDHGRLKQRIKLARGSNTPQTTHATIKGSEVKMVFEDRLYIRRRNIQTAILGNIYSVPTPQSCTIR
jgi:transposase-like protein